MRVMIAMSANDRAVGAMTLLVDRGHRVDVASHPRDVKDALAARDLDVVLMDGAWIAREGIYGLAVMKGRAARTVRFLLLEENGAPHAGDYERDWFDEALTMPVRGGELIEMVERSRRLRRRYQPDIQRRGLAA